MSDAPHDVAAPGSIPAESVVWHPRFGFGVLDLREQVSASAVTVDFGPHWGRQAVEGDRGAMASAPPPAEVEPATRQRSPIPFDRTPRPARFGARSPVATEGEFLKSLNSWRVAVDWIERDWDDIDVYQCDLYTRILLERRMGSLAAGRGSLRVEWVRQVHAIDGRFLAATVGVPLRDFLGPGSFNRCWRDPDVFWYLYRWPPDADADIGCGDVLVYWSLDS